MEPPQKAPLDQSALLAPRPELQRFNALVAGELENELSKPLQPHVPGGPPVEVSEEAEITSLHLEVYAFDDDGKRPLTEEELDSVGLFLASIELVSELGTAVSHDAPNGEAFLVRDLIAAVEATERRTRGEGSWSGGIDLHHTFFEGIDELSEGRFRSAWGS